MLLVRFGSMGVVRGKATLHVAAGMRRHALTFQEQLHRLVRQAHLHFAVHQLIRHAVQMPVDLHMVIDVDLGLAPRRGLVGLARQRQQRGPVQLLEEFPAGTRQLLERLPVDFLQELPDSRVQFAQAEELPIPQRG